MSDGLKWILAGLVGYWLYENYVAPQQPLQPITAYNVAPSPSPAPTVSAPPAPVSRIPQVVNAVSAAPLPPEIPGYQIVSSPGGGWGYVPAPAVSVPTPQGPAPTVAYTPPALPTVGPSPIVTIIPTMPTFMPGAPGTINFEAIGSGSSAYGPSDASEYGDSQGLPAKARNLF